LQQRSDGLENGIHRIETGLKQQVRVLEVSNQDLQVDISEKVSFDQLKLMLKSIGNNNMSEEDKAKMLD
jgi:predicted component of type VI protein secretion system